MRPGPRATLSVFVSRTWRGCIIQESAVLRWEIATDISRHKQISIDGSAEADQAELESTARSFRRELKRDVEVAAIATAAAPLGANPQELLSAPAGDALLAHSPVVARATGFEGG